MVDPRAGHGGWTIAWCLAALTAGVVYLQPPTPWMRRGVVHVAPDGFDGWLGGDRRLAVRTIQRGLDLARAGETVLVWPGVYRESLRLRHGGRAGRPLILRAAVPGQAVISGTADPSVSRHWSWQPVGPRRYRTRTPWRIDGLRVDGVMAYRARRATDLDALCRRPGAMPAFQMRGDHQLDLCLPQGRPPQQRRLDVNRRIPARRRSGGHQVALLWVEAPHVEIRDLVFDFPVMAAIQLWNTHHLRISGNAFHGADVAIDGSTGLRQPHQLLIDHNVSDCRPLYQWRQRGWLSWAEVYPYSNCSLTWIQGRDISLRHNLISEAGDGIKLSPLGGRNRIEANVIAFTTDDGIELDGAASNLEVSHNLVVATWASLGISPVSTGPLRIHHNLFLQQRQNPLSGNGVWLKLMGGPIHGVTLDHNLFLGQRLAWSVPDSPVSDFSLQNNLLLLVDPAEAGFHARRQVAWQDNRAVVLPWQAWPPPDLGPPALLALLESGVGDGPPLPLELPLPILRPGPAWYRLEQEASGRQLKALLDAGWIRSR
ncbi:MULTISPECIES: right-handed parallel beta-helix repeat-containing protein [unclassified Cyanobium]|uniref:right-handed parallel beta-helix repeat-containing protein n=1 Tax=unclassified Cyanobium TaxID=2627006 RepID=UPI0020CE96F6|nr:MULTISPECIES: right-handed parallel beta-helix repeat-containing protein [unclassified Cyanobium]